MSFFAAQTIWNDIAREGWGMRKIEHQLNKLKPEEKTMPEMPKAIDPDEARNAAMKTAEAATTQRRRAIARGGQTTFTSPLGTGTQASTARSSLLGV